MNTSGMKVISLQEELQRTKATLAALQGQDIVLDEKALETDQLRKVISERENHIKEMQKRIDRANWNKDFSQNPKPPEQMKMPR